MTSSPPPPQQGRYRLFTTLSIGIVLLLTAIGGIVRATGSGMGCPDWPKCFGYIIPPSEEAQIQFQPGRSFEKGNMVIHDQALWKAKADFKAAEKWEAENWEKYTRHSYATFNVYHTWTEYVNRLFGALTGVVILGLFFTSLPYRKSDILITVGAFLSVLLVGFEGWLGKLVVDTQLKTGMITIHMAVAMLLLMLLLALRFRAFPQVVEGVVFPLRTRLIGIATLALLLIQILLGTQVREAVDVLAHTLGEGSRTTWVQQLGSAFLYHSNLYFVVVAMMGYWIYDMRGTLTAHIYVKKYTLLLGVLTAIEILAGILLANFALPPALQPLHLVIATAMVAVLAWIIALMFVRAPKTLS